MGGETKLAATSFLQFWRNYVQETAISPAPANDLGLARIRHGLDAADRCDYQPHRCKCKPRGRGGGGGGGGIAQLWTGPALAAVSRDGT